MLALIADSHVSPLPPSHPGMPDADDFFAMLDALARSPHDILFLGDNLDLWIGSADAYENDVQRRFRDWCRQQRHHRRLLFVEGNHEFYICRHFADCFTRCAETTLTEHGRLFVHGDVTQRALGFHRIFRRLAKNAFGDWMMAHLPGGVAFAAAMKRLLSHRHREGVGNERGDWMPREDVERWVAAEGRRHGVAEVYMGHFHFACQGERGGVRYRVLPAWKYDGAIGLLDEETGDCRVAPWRTALDTPRNHGEEND